MSIKYPQLRNRGWLYRKYWEEELSTVEIAKEVGCSYGTVMYRMEKLDIPRRSLSEAGKIKTPVKYPQLQDRDWLYQKYWEEGLSTREIEEEVGCAHGIVRDHMKKLKIPRRAREDTCGIAIKYSVLYDVRWLREQYVDKELDSCDIAVIVGCSPATVLYALENAGIARRSTSFYHTSSFHRKQRRHHRLYDKEWMIQKYVTDGRNQTEIASLLGCNSSSVAPALHSFGIPIRDTKGERNHNFQHPKAHDRDFLWQRYIVEGKYTTEIAKEIGCTSTTILKRLKVFGIPTKTMKELANEEKWKEQQSESALNQWKDKDIVKRMFSGFKAKPNKFESRIDQVLQKFVPNEWKYNGNFDCEILIGGLIPDFVNINGRKQLIEGFGDPFHDGTFSSSWKRTEFGRKAVFSQFGYDVLILWYSDVNKMTDEKIAEVVKAFMGQEGKRKKSRKR